MTADTQDIVELAIKVLVEAAGKQIYRELRPDELVEKGDEFLNSFGVWEPSNNWKRQLNRKQSAGYKYRRLVNG